MPAKARASPIRSKDPCAEWKRKLKERDAELKEAREQQAATSEVLKVISRSPGDLQPVLDTIAERAARLCNSHDAQVFRLDGDFLRMVTNFGSMPGLPVGTGLQMDRGSVTGRAVVDGCTVHVLDLAAESDDEYPEGRARQRRFGHRTTLATPLLLEGVPVGAILIRRREVQAYTASQIQLLETFAAQAVVAIENARLFNETKEALEQQTVISEILRVISSSPTDTQPVFDAIVKAGVPLFGGTEISLRLVKGDYSDLVASTRSSYVLDGYNRMPLDDESHPGARAIRRQEVVQVPNIAVADEWVGAAYKQRAEQREFRAVMSAPLLRENKAIGAITVDRAAQGRFSDKQVALLKTFADQAVIAIENVRLFNETKEALEQQTATAEILKVISSSPADIQPVFDAVAESAARLCGAHDVVIRLVDGTMSRVVAHHGPIPVNPPRALTRANMGSRAILDARTVHISDVTEARVQEEYPETWLATGQRTFLAAPLVREDRAIGTIVMRRQEVRPFTDRQIKLLETFAAQAVIAIENVRLFKELQARNAEITEALEQQTATAEILKVISSSPTNLEPVFDAILENAMRLCDAHMANLSLYDGDRRILVGQRGGNTEYVKWATSRGLVQIFVGSNTARVIAERRPIQIADLSDSSSYLDRTPGAVALVELAGARTFVVVPMIKEGRVVGGIAIYRPEVRPFTQKQIDLVSTFANQAVIAIDNVRLFNETKEALEQQTATAEILRVISESPTDTQPVFDAIVDSAVRLSGGLGVTLRLVKGDSTEVVATTRPGVARTIPLSDDRGASSRAILRREVVHVPDVLAESWIREEIKRHAAVRGRAIMCAPMLREDRAIGAIVVNRANPGAFTDRQIVLLQTFADQAVIAIENARLFNEIQEKSRQLEIADRHKSEFLANMSHELRTPLNAVIGFSEVLQQGMVGALNDKQGEYIEYIHKSGSHLLSLINDILDLSKVEAGRMELDLASFSVPLAIDNALTLVRERATRHGLTLGCTLDPSIADIHADERKFKQVMLNLLSNAVKFTPEGGRITVAAHPVNEGVEVSVADTGIGIAPEDCDAVFEEFRQVGRHAEGKAEGTGLGLALARKFIELHGGRIWLTSIPGKGSTFSFTLPVAQPAAQAVTAN